MKIIPTAIPDVIVIEPKLFGDQRGLFFEAFSAQRYKECGIDADFVQDNFSRSTKNVLRGLHYQIEKPQGKLVWVTRGKVFDVAVDIRRNSPTFGQSVVVELDAESMRQIYIPPGFAHGFCVLSDEVDFNYKCTDYYYPALEKGIRWDDPEINISWPIIDPILSAKDQKHPSLKDVESQYLL